MQHRPRKRFGQNFLQNQSIINAILHAFNPQSTDRVLEIGPGLGALTKPLLKRLDHLYAVEIDTDLQTYWSTLPEAQERLTLIAGDALTVDYHQFGSRLRILGNLPYNISTPLLLRLLHYVDSIHDMYFMLQKEVVDRIVAPPGNKTYGRLSVMIQYYCEVEFVLEVPPTAFNPQPNVDSAVIYLSPHQQSPYPDIAFADLECWVARSFAMRRKTIANNLKPWLSADDWVAIGIDRSLRPEQLSVIDYVRIIKFVTE